VGLLPTPEHNLSLSSCKLLANVIFLNTAHDNLVPLVSSWLKSHLFTTLTTISEVFQPLSSIQLHGWPHYTCFILI
jgi:hypothetical protein